MAFYSISFGRQFGSGGRDIAKLVAERLGYRFCDRDLITLSAEESNLSTDTVNNIDERPTTSLLYSIVTNTSAFTGSGALGYNVPINDRLFLVQSELIKRISGEENAVFVGRCSDYVLADSKNNFSVFIYGDNEHRIQRVCERHQLEKRAAADLINKTDRRRASYYNFYTGKKWGSMQDYDLCINSSLLGIEFTAETVVNYALRFREKREAEAKNG